MPLTESKKLVMEHYVPEIQLNPSSALRQEIQPRSVGLNGCVWDIRSVGPNSLLYPLAWIKWNLTLTLRNAANTANVNSDGTQRVCLKDGLPMTQAMTDMTLVVNGSSVSMNFQDFSKKWLMINGSKVCDKLFSTAGGDWDELNETSTYDEYAVAGGDTGADTINAGGNHGVAGQNVLKVVDAHALLLNVGEVYDFQDGGAHRLYKVIGVGRPESAAAGETTITLDRPLVADTAANNILKTLKGQKYSGDKTRQKRINKFQRELFFGVGATATVEILEPVLIPPFNPFVEFDPRDFPTWSPYPRMTKAIPHMNNATLSCNFQNLDQSVMEMVDGLHANRDTQCKITAINNASLIMRWYEAPRAANYRIPASIELQSFGVQTYRKRYNATTVEANQTKDANGNYTSGGRSNQFTSDFIRLDQVPDLFIFTVEKPLSSFKVDGNYANKDNRDFFTLIEQLEITINAKASALQTTISAKELYHMTCENYASYKHVLYDFEESKRRFVVCLRPDQLGLSVAGGVQNPTNIVFNMFFVNTLGARSSEWDVVFQAVNLHELLQITPSNALYRKQAEPLASAQGRLMGPSAPPPPQSAEGAGVRGLRRRVQSNY